MVGVSEPYLSGNSALSHSHIYFYKLYDHTQPGRWDQRASVAVATETLRQTFLRDAFTQLSCTRLQLDEVFILLVNE